MPNVNAPRPSSSKRRDRDACRGRRRAVTLVELLLVMVLLVVIGGLAVPTLTGSFASTRLRRAGDEVVGAWSKARRHAIDSGLTYQFRYKLDDNVYRVEPFTTLDAMQLSGGTSAGASAAATPAGSNRSATGSPTSGAYGTSSSPPSAANSRNAGERNETDEEPEDQDLPDEVVFQDGQMAQRDPLQSETQIDRLQQRGQTWTRPILFYPDGTTSNASIVLKNSRDQFIRVTLRGLTGVGRATSILSKAEAAKPASRRK